MIRFINKKAENYTKLLNENNCQQLFRKFVDKQKNRNQITLSRASERINHEKIKKVASEVQFLGYDKDYCMIFGIYGPKIDCNDINELLFTLNQIIQESFYSKNQIISNSYKKHSTLGITFIFFNNMITKKRKINLFSNKNLLNPILINQFKQEIIKKIPLRNLIKINNIILLYPSLLTKSWNYLTSFGIQNGFFDNYFYYIDTIYDLVQLMGPLFNVQQIDQKVLIYSSSTINSHPNIKNWKTIYSKHQKIKSINEFESYEKLCQETQIIYQDENEIRFQYKSKLKDYFIDKTSRIPFIIDIIFNQIENKYLNYEGLFRKVADQRQLIQFQKFIHQNIDMIHQEISNQQKQNILASKLIEFQVQTLTSFIKKIFIKLEKQSLITQDVYKKILKLQEFGNKQLHIFNLSQINEQRQEIKINQQQIEIKQNCLNVKKPIYQSENSKPINTKNDFLSKIAFFQNISSNNKHFSQNNHKKVINQKNQKKMIKFNKVQGSKNHEIPSKQRLTSKNQVKMLFSQIKQNSQINYETLKSTINLLNKICKNQKFNLMSSYNLAICFVPCFFGHFTQQIVQINDLSNKQSQINMIQSLHKQCDLNMKLIKGLAKIIQKPQVYFQ